MDPAVTLAKLVEKATSRKHVDVPEDLLRGIKDICKQSDANVASAFKWLADKLKAPNSQTRLLALRIVDELFSRSKAFRALMAPSFPRFLEHTLGFRAENRLPAPTEAAASLRRATLEVVERWRLGHGRKYKQIEFGYRYLRDALKFEFPNVRQRQAQQDEQQRQRRERAQSALHEKYEAMRRELDSTEAEMRSDLRQLDESLALLVKAKEAAEREEGLVGVDGSGTAAGTGIAEMPQADQVADGDEDDGLEWEEAGAGAAAPGLGGASAGSPYPPELVSSLRESASLLARRHMPRIGEWLRVSSRLDAGAPGERSRAERDAYLGRLTGLRGDLAAGRARYQQAEEYLDLPSEEVWDGAASGRGSASDKPGGGSGGTNSRGDSASAAAAAGSGADGTKGDGGGGGGAGKSNPYERIHDPAAPRKRKERPLAVEPPPPAARTRPSGAPQAAAAGSDGALDAALQPAAGMRRGGSGRVGGERQGGGGGLPDGLKARLLQQAPVLEAGVRLTDHWEHSGQCMADNRGLEINNHWGAVDLNAELSLAKRNELFGAVAQYYTPLPPSSSTAANKQPAAQQQQQQRRSGKEPAAEPAAPPPMPPLPPQQQQQPVARQQQQQDAGDRNGAPAAAAAAAAAAGSGGLVPLCPPPSSSDTATAAAAGSASGRPLPSGFSARGGSAPLAPWPSSGAAGAAGLGQLGGSGSSRRATRAAERAFNLAVLGAAAGGPDAALAQALQQEEEERAAGRRGAQGGFRRGAAPQRPKMTVRERLARKLLNPRASNRATEEIGRAEEETVRDRTANRF